MTSVVSCRDNGSSADPQHQVGCRVLSLRLLPLQPVCGVHHNADQHAWLVVSLQFIAFSQFRAL